MKLKKEINKIEKEIEEGIEDVEKWVYERRKFFTKLGYAIGLVILLLIISSFL